ncbi:hypothetical protein GEV33_002588 [Tenebrio molitor]|uniref:Uncharacterized protein n=1 Tax=Tenebrio molitor TaxID=7067 RepID=A0A8J6HV99_TENMO|nr:hypothetical protein GEV33_002588 [Tenebrio molitor]
MKTERRLCRSVNSSAFFTPISSRPSVARLFGEDIFPVISLTLRLRKHNPGSYETGILDPICQYIRKLGCYCCLLCEKYARRELQRLSGALFQNQLDFSPPADDHRGVVKCEEVVWTLENLDVIKLVKA